MLRFFQQPTGVYHGSVFYQLSGAVGPSCLAVDQEGNVYVGQFDVKESSSEGSVLILSSAGKLKGSCIDKYVHTIYIHALLRFLSLCVGSILTAGAEISGMTIQ